MSVGFSQKSMKSTTWQTVNRCGVDGPWRQRAATTSLGLKNPAASQVRVDATGLRL